LAIPRSCVTDDTDEFSVNMWRTHRSGSGPASPSGVEGVPRESQGFGQVGGPAGAVAGLARVDLEGDRAVPACGGEFAEQLGARLRAAAGHEVLVAAGLSAVAQVYVAQLLAHPLGHRHRVGPRGRAVRQVEGVGVVAVSRGIPV